MDCRNEFREKMQYELEVLMKERYDLTIKDIKKLINKESKKRSVTLLSETEKTILTLKFDLNDNGIKYTLEEIGEKLKMSKSNVSLKMHHALAKLYGYKF